MAISTPNTWTLNWRGIDWLNAELAAWQLRAQGLYGADLRAAQAYIEAVRAERDQRQASYSRGVWGAVQGGFGAVFEIFGGSGGPGAPGLAGSIAQTASDASQSVSDTVGKYTGWVLLGLAVLGGFYLWLRFKK